MAKETSPRFLDLYGADLTGIDASGLDLSNGVFSFAQMKDFKLVKGTIHEARFIGTKLSGAIISKSKFFCSNFAGAELSGADLSESVAMGSIFTTADLSEAKFIGADLYLTNFAGARLKNTNFEEADLAVALFHGSDLSKTNFNKAKMGKTIFGDCDLNDCVGLEEVKHIGPSSIGLDTLLKTFVNAGNCFTPKIEVFLINCGVPKHVIDGLPEILANIQYCSCFVAYGELDRAFAERIKKDLVAKGVSCWVYSLDSTPGERTWPEISRRRREADRVIVLCSAASLVREGVLKEIEEQIDEDPDKILPVSLDDTWKSPGFPVKRGERDLKQFLLDHNYADFCGAQKYNQSLCRLLRGLKKNRKRRK